MRAKLLLVAGVGLVVLGAVATVIPLHAFGGGTCGSIFNARTLPNGTRFNSVGPVNVCSHASVHTRTVEVLALLILGGCLAALGACAARR